MSLRRVNTSETSVLGVSFSSSLQSVSKMPWEDHRLSNKPTRA